jgi:putative hemolysin
MKLSLLSAVLFTFNSSATATAHQDPSRNPSLKASGNKANLRGSSLVLSFQDYVKNASENGLEISSEEQHHDRCYQDGEICINAFVCCGGLSCVRRSGQRVGICRSPGSISEGDMAEDSLIEEPNTKVNNDEVHPKEVEAQGLEIAGTSELEISSEEQHHDRCYQDGEICINAFVCCGGLSCVRRSGQRVGICRSPGSSSEGDLTEDSLIEEPNTKMNADE